MDDKECEKPNCHQKCSWTRYGLNKPPKIYSKYCPDHSCFLYQCYRERWSPDHLFCPQHRCLWDHECRSPRLIPYLYCQNHICKQCGSHANCRAHPQLDIKKQLLHEIIIKSVFNQDYQIPPSVHQRIESYLEAEKLFIPLEYWWFHQNPRQAYSGPF